MNKYKTLLAMTAGLLISPAAFAEDYNCEGCSLPQMQSKAISFGEGEYRIYSFSTNLAYRFSVTCSGNIPLGTPEQPQSDSTSQENQLTPSTSTTDTRVDDSSTDAVPNQCPLGRPLQVKTKSLFANEKDAFDLMRAYIVAHPAGSGGRGTDIGYNTSQQPGNSQYGDSVSQVLHDNFAYTKLTDEIGNNVSGIAQFIAAAVAGANSSFNTGPNATSILVTFRDGSSLIIQYDRTTMQFKIVPHSTRDAKNDAIIENNEQGFEGTYYTSGGGISMGDYLALLQRAGVPVVTASGVAKGFSCSWNQSTHTLTCRVIYM